MRPENEAALRARHPSLLALLVKTQPTADVDLIPSRRGPVTLRWTSTDHRVRYLHSAVDPEGEAEKIAGAVLTAGAQSADRPLQALLVGHGAGHVIRALARRVEELWVIAADLPLLSFVCNHVDVSDLFLNPRIQWIFGNPADQKNRLGQLMNGVPDVERAAICTILHPPFLERIPDEHRGLVDAVARLRQGRDTEDQIGPTARENLRRNVDALDSPGVASLFGLARDRQVVVAGASPSLDGCLDALQELFPAAYLIAVDTVAEGLAESGMTPDLIVSVDPREDSLLHFRYPQLLAAARLVFTPISHPEIVRRFEGRRFLASPAGHFLLGPAESLMSHKGVLTGGGSVSVLAASLAAAMTPAQVCLAGIDFSVEQSGTGRDARFYSRLASYLRQDPARPASRFSSPESAEYDILLREIRKTTRDPKGDAPRLKSYAAEFRNMVERSPVPFYSLGRGTTPTARTDSPVVRPIRVPPSEPDQALGRTVLAALDIPI